jgi:hypothetical protein
MAEDTAQYSIRISIDRESRGSLGGPNSIKQVVGDGITILTGVGALDVNSPSQTNVELNDAQFTGLCGYIGLIKAGVDTSSLETSIATAVAAN